MSGISVLIPLDLLMENGKLIFDSIDLCRVVDINQDFIPPSFISLVERTLIRIRCRREREKKRNKKRRNIYIFVERNNPRKYFIIKCHVSPVYLIYIEFCPCTLLVFSFFIISSSSSFFAWTKRY